MRYPFGVKRGLYVMYVDFKTNISDLEALMGKLRSDNTFSQGKRARTFNLIDIQEKVQQCFAVQFSWAIREV